ncbi:fungal-specific transcription factor domain-containing protein [Rhodocollybia butyracea]|uniref:Fungal-specific transcription factor domain-containing protein n=1 Tax=Rhodocollybia butyracea TaxID=206335 RepID=A0A9P5PSN5_9AGAR|nr:fungal-specific transcription factor domain-containing protein [Rhodocollybia butyracea]
MSTGPDRPKRRGNSCDTCKKRKVKCVGAPGKNGSCNTCLASKLTCTYDGTFKNRVISKDYIERLEARLSEVELLLKQAQSTNPSSSNAVQPSSQDYRNSDSPPTALSSNPNLNEEPNGGEELELSDEDFDGVSILHQGISSLSISPRFHGRSSSSKLVSDIFEKRQATEQYSSRTSSSSTLVFKRPEFWSPFPWESQPEPFHQFDFPPQDLLDSLVSLFFEHVNYLYALLNRPAFETLIAQGLHYHDAQFADVVLLVIAIGSKFSTDSRVVLEGSGTWRSSGFKWFSQVNIYKKATLSVPSLYNLQAIVLYTLHQQNSPSQEEGWSLLSSGIRLAQAMGAHRKKVYASKLTVTDELWKRAFWCLYMLDRQTCLALGRPCSLHDEEFDLDLPIDCDDEYWVQENPEDCFKQPPDKPSKITFVIRFIEASVILSHALRTIYSINKSKAVLGYTGQGWEERLVAELNSRLNNWEARIPSHLRLSTGIRDPLFFIQAAVLSSAYHDLRILVHHPFVAPGGKSSSITYLCLATCDNAARACSSIACLVSQRAPMTLAPILLHTAFTSAIILFFKLFSARRAGTVIDITGTMSGVHGCMGVLENAESRTWLAGQYRDILYNLAMLGDLPLPSTSSAPFPPSNYSATTPTAPISNDIAIPFDALHSTKLPHYLDDPQAQIVDILPLTFDTDEQLRNMWNDAPMGMGFDTDWANYLTTLNWMQPNAPL